MEVKNNKNNKNNKKRKNKNPALHNLHAKNTLKSTTGSKTSMKEPKNTTITQSQTPC